MKETEYTFAVAYLKTLENKMLTSDEIETLLNSDFNEALKFLRDKGFGGDLKGDEKADEVVKAELKRIWDEVNAICPEETPLELLMHKNDFHNIKTVLKSFVSGEDAEDLFLFPATIEKDKLYEAVKNKDFADIPEFFVNHLKKAYDIITKTMDGQMTEAYLDRAYLEEELRLAKESRSQFLQELAELEILTANVKIAARTVGRNKDFISGALAQNKYKEKLLNAAITSKEEVISVACEIFPEGGKFLEKSFSDFEKWCDNKKIRYIKQWKNKFFGVEPVFAFLIGKEFELQTVRIILCGKENGVDNKVIKERLRDIYV